MKRMFLSLVLGLILSAVPIAIYAQTCCPGSVTIGKSTCRFIDEDCTDPNVGICYYGECDPPLDN